jgi:pyruvate, orthophosphate dikinase
MSPDSPRYIYDFDAPPDLPPAEMRALMGGKAANLVVMASELGLPVPPGFTVTTEACRSYLGGKWPVGLAGELRAHMERLGGLFGRRFGDAENPLLVSVRSGAPVSMPGMMDTILDLGVTSATVIGLARGTGSTAFADDCRRRLADGWRIVIDGSEPPDDVWEQLRQAVEAVFRSWNSDRAKAYRHREGIADDLGTAVTVQAMVFGNRGADSGTGVLFTRNPSTGEPALYGDIMFNAQGEDVVAGTHVTEPIAVLDDRLPSVAAELRRHADTLERHLRDVADIEFTIEQGRLWMLQVRVGKRSPRAALRMAIDMAEDREFPLSREEAVRRVASQLAEPPGVFVYDGYLPQPITTGLPASPGVASGEIVLTSSAAMNARKPVILVRRETSPEDVGGIAKAAGVLTATGGLASHAAVVARGWGIPAVVGATDIQPADDYVIVAGVRLAMGEVITIDGSTGHVYRGELAGYWDVTPEAATLLSWAKDLGAEIAPGPTVAAAAPPPATDNDRYLLVRLLAIKGMAPTDTIAEALMMTPEAVQPEINELIANSLAADIDGNIRLTDAGTTAAAELFATASSRYTDEAAVDLLGQFHELDVRMKSIVTAWQLRDVDGEQTLNDHSDGAYDAQVLADLAALRSDADRWLDGLDGLSHLGPYRARLARALEHARAGDRRYVASPRVDSYHSAWFELHEDLIRSTGRNRADEVAAGRA